MERRPRVPILRALSWRERKRERARVSNVECDYSGDQEPKDTKVPKDGVSLGTYKKGQLRGLVMR